MSETKPELLSTGEIAKACGVIVRTVQYYDARGLLAPTELTEGGRRMYSDEDVKKLRLLCYLRSLGLSIDGISRIFREENAGNVISTLLEEQIRTLDAEVNEKREQLKEARGFLSEIRSAQNVSSRSIQDIAYVMDKKKNMKRMYALMIGAGLAIDAVEVLTLIYAIKSGIWWPFIAGMVLVIISAVLLTRYYYKHAAYVCPECHEVFKPKFWEAFFAPHTP